MNKSTCRWPECAVTKMTGRGLCKNHYARAKYWKNFENPWDDGPRPRPAQAAVPCRWPGCKRESSSRDLCSKHYSRAWAVKDFERPWDSLTSVCFVCGVQFCRVRAQRATNTYCSAPCRARAKRITHPERERERNRNRYYAQRAAWDGEMITTQSLRDRDGDACYLCGAGIDFEIKWPHAESPSLDHVHPISLGGAHSMKNTALTHLQCNIRKGVRVLSETEK